jgi:hypothetical protein
MYGTNSHKKLAPGRVARWKIVVVRGRLENLILQSARSFTDARARASAITPLIDSFHRL